jgi:hypothetical protein
MLSLSNPRKPAPILACGGIGLRLHVGPNAFGNALGSSLADTLSRPAEQSNAGQKRLFTQREFEKAMFGDLPRPKDFGGFGGLIGDEPPALTFAEDVARRSAALDWMIPKIPVVGRYMSPDEKLDALFGRGKMITFTQTQAPPQLREVGLLENLSNIASAYRKDRIGFGTAASMAWDNVKFSYRGSQRAQGATQVVNGGLQVWGGTMLSGTGVGGVVGLPLAAHGGDNIGTGLRRLWTGQAQNTVTFNAVHAATGSERTAAFVDSAIPFVGGVAMGGTAINAVSRTSNSVLNGSARTSTYTGDVYAADFVGPVEWKMFYRGDATLRTDFLSSMAQERGLAQTAEFLNSRSSGQLNQLFADHGLGSQGLPTIGVSQNRQVAEYFARGPAQNQNGFVTTFRLEARDAQMFARPNYENPLSFFEVNPAIGLPEQEFLFSPLIDPKFIFKQTQVGPK